MLVEVVVIAVLVALGVLVEDLLWVVVAVVVVVVV